jgi:anti-sigma regulatory factor (Ser/Thr protein kinase)
VTLTDTLVMRAELSELARAAVWAKALADKYSLSASTSYALQLCLEEAVSNIVRHGFAGQQPDEEIRLSFIAASDAVFLTIEDDAMAFDPIQVASPAMPTPLSEMRIGGLGIHLMRQFADELSYERRNGCNRLTLRFKIPMSSA